jgi:thiol-disulfide isomerase/thioredoxin
LNALDDDALPSRAAQLRAMLEATQNPRDLRVFSALWAAEFRLTPKADADAEKQRIAADLKRLREIDGVKATIANGAKLIGDDALAKEMTPPPKPDVWAELQAWQRTHVYPAKDASARYKQTFGEAQLEASAKWIAMAPNSVTGYNSRFYALLAMDGPLDQIAKAGADLVRVARTDDRAAGSEYIAVVAERYVERGILLDRVPALMEEAVKGFDDPEAVIEIDLSPIPDLAESNRMNFTRWHVDAIVTLSEYYEKLGQMDKARDVLSPIPAFLATKSVPAGVQDVDLGHNLLLFYGLAHYSYWKRLGELDDHENRKEEALNEYRQALLAWDLGRADLLPKQRGLWKDLGRPDDAWQAWVDSIPKYEQNRPPTFAFAAVHRPLAKIALKDLDGNEWPPDRFASKTTIAVVWATWCAPCVQELPYFAQLVERLKDRTDVQVVSFNTDENPGLAKSFIQKNGYKFPVLIAKNFAEDLMPYLSIPRTWIIRDGSVVEEAEGWGLSWNQWLDRIVAQVK